MTTATTTTLTIPMPNGADVEMLLNCVLIVGNTAVTADDPAVLVIAAATEEEAHAVARDPLGWIERAQR